MNNQTAIKGLKLFTDEVVIESLKDAGYRIGKPYNINESILQLCKKCFSILK